tara:strand:- start:55 stop:498 length:444 start_codon:yes stop_codon:yes gene_type:complete
MMTDSTDSISPDAANTRFVAAVKAKRVTENATRVVDLTIEQMMTDDGSGPVLYVPGHQRARILRLYGGHTFLDFDELYDFNRKIGAPYDNCFASMMYWMNKTQGILRDQFQKLAHDALLSDLFNIVQSAVRARVGECVWYECDSNEP